MAMGNPVALEARAELRETRGFISITTISPVIRVNGELDVAPSRFHPDLPDDGYARHPACPDIPYRSEFERAPR